MDKPEPLSRSSSEETLDVLAETLANMNINLTEDVRSDDQDDQEVASYLPELHSVSCDSCLKGNFRGKRYKCLICYDYDLCSTCYEAGATSTRHTTEHPMQCILTRSDFDLYYGGEVLSSEQPQSFTCPFCGRLGFTEATLQEHVTSDHPDLNYEVVCPVCASMPVGDPNLVTDDFAGHLTLEHRNPTRDLISFLDEPTSRHGVRRVPPPAARAISSRARRSNINFRKCQAHAPREPQDKYLLPWPKEKEPWSRIHMDFAASHLSYSSPCPYPPVLSPLSLDFPFPPLVFEIFLTSPPDDLVRPVARTENVLSSPPLFSHEESGPFVRPRPQILCPQIISPPYSPDPSFPEPAPYSPEPDIPTPPPPFPDPSIPSPFYRPSPLPPDSDIPSPLPAVPAPSQPILITSPHGVNLLNELPFYPDSPPSSFPEPPEMPPLPPDAENGPPPVPPPMHPPPIPYPFPDPPASEDNVDPIAELLSQLSGVRRNQASTPSQLQQLQMQLQLERQQVRAARQQLERMPRRPTGSQLLITAPVTTGCGTAISYVSSSSSNESVANSPKFLLSRYLEKTPTEAELEKSEEERADRCMFVRDLLFAALCQSDTEGRSIAALLEDLMKSAEGEPIPDQYAAGSSQHVTPQASSENKKIPSEKESSDKSDPKH